MSNYSTQKTILSLFVFVLSGCGYNTLQQRDEQVKAAWSYVLSQYQRRADLIPNLVQTVQGYATFEKDTLTAVIKARAEATQIRTQQQEAPTDPNAIAKAEAGVSQALSRLLVVVERYPELKANRGFQQLQNQLAMTENQISFARKRYIEEVQNYNIVVRSFPTNLTAMMFGHTVKPNFTPENENELKKPPKVAHKNERRLGTV